VAGKIYGKRGWQGSHVTRIQQQLNKLAGAGLTPDGDFGEKTEAAVKAFQKSYGFMSDGIVGDFTNAALTLTTFQYTTLRIPPQVRQTQLRCWAAATESWLRTQLHRTPYTQEQIVAGMQAEGYARADGSLPVGSQSVWEDRVGLRPITESSSAFLAERAKARLAMEGKPLILGLGGSMGHMMVLYGVVANGLNLQILVMDPMSAAHPAARNVSDIQARTGTVTTWMSKLPLMP
jgi:hypothetical protein